MTTNQPIVLVGDLIDFVLKNRKGNAWKNQTPEQIYMDIDQSLKDNSLFYCTKTGTDIVTGLVTLQKLEDNTVFVKNLLATESGVICLFFNLFRTYFPYHGVIKADRRKKVRSMMTYKNLSRLGHLLRLVSKIKQ